jgi:membrane protein implicated in regulation of membrane protease activity
MKSRLFTLDTRDLINGLIIAFLTATLSGIIEIFGNGAVFTWLTFKPVLIAGISAACAYLLKSFSTNSHHQLLTKEPSSIK